MMERLGITLEDAPSMFGWRSIVSWSDHITRDHSSHSWRSLNGKRAEFANIAQQSEILASIYDAIAAQNSLLSSHFSHKAYKRPKPYPRPYRSGNTKTYGRDPIPIKDFYSWYYGR